MRKMTAGTWGRLLYGLVFVVFGILHFVNIEGIAGNVPEFLPYATFWAVVTGIIMLVAGLSILTKRYVRVSTMVLAVLLAVYVVLIHLPALPLSVGAFLKDLGLLGGALLIINRYHPHHHD